MGAALASSSQAAPAAIYCSDLARAVETATAIAAAFPAPPPALTQLPSLRERDVGRLLEGVRRAEAPSIAPEAFAALRRSAHDPSLPLPGGGESLNSVAQRVGTALLDIARAHPGEAVVVVSHGGAIHAARRYAEGVGGGGSGSSAGVPLPNGALCEFRVHARLAAEEQQSSNGTVARCPGGQWRRGWAIARWGDCCLLGQRAAQAGTEGGGADAG
jgi:broad specificity phosphatase PhoE